jgi:hypothetical protein
VGQCQRCDMEIGADRRVAIAHLVEFHLLDPARATREVDQPEVPVANCKLCERFAPNKCKRHREANGSANRAASAKPKKRGKRPRQTATAKVARFSFDRALSELRAERERLDSAITALEALA